MKLPAKKILWSGFILSCINSVNASDTKEKILFVSNEHGNAQIQIMNKDGSERRALTSGREENTEPAWSPDGKRIAFTSYRDGNAEIYVMENDGSNQQRLTRHELADNSPIWTAEGKIIFRSMRDQWANFYLINADGSDLKQLTTEQIDKGTPILSPNGKWLAFVTHADKGISEIYTVPILGGEIKNLTAGLSQEKKAYPAWSPDSQKLIYVAEKKPTGLNIQMIDKDGLNPIKITDNLYTNANPTWSPDGKLLAFVSSREGSLMEQARGDIYVMNSDGSNPRNLTNHPDEDNYPIWSADSQTIYFVSLRDGNAQIYGISAQGGEAVRLTHDKGYNVMIRPWLPLKTPNNLAAINLTLRSSQ